MILSALLLLLRVRRALSRLALALCLLAGHDGHDLLCRRLKHLDIPRAHVLPMQSQPPACLVMRPKLDKGLAGRSIRLIVQDLEADGLEGRRGKEGHDVLRRARKGKAAQPEERVTARDGWRRTLGDSRGKRSGAHVGHPNASAHPATIDKRTAVHRTGRRTISI